MAWPTGKNIHSSLVQVSIVSENNIWGVDASDRIFQYNGTTWASYPGQAMQVSAGPDGTMWIVRRDGLIFRTWPDRTYSQVQGTLKQVSVASATLILGVTPTSQVVQYTNNTSLGMAPIVNTDPMKVVSVNRPGSGMYGDIWGITPSGGLAKFAEYSVQKDWTPYETKTAEGQTIQFTQIASARGNVLYGLAPGGRFYQWIGGGNSLVDFVHLGAPLARYISLADDLSVALIDMQGNTWAYPKGRSM